MVGCLILYRAQNKELQEEMQQKTGINNGEWYKTGWDKLHNISVTGMYKLNEKWSFSSIFSLQSGQPLLI